LASNMFGTKTLSVALLTLAAVTTLPGCDAPAPREAPVVAAQERGPLGKADAAGSCATPDGDFCGGQSADGCWCDDACADFGDCCADAEPVCGVGDAPECPAEDDPTIEWVSTDVLECAAILFGCEEGQEQFSDECGCGCIGEPEPEPEPNACPDPEDPAVHYLHEDPLECLPILFGCEEGQELFSDECGCGCID